MSKLLDKYRKAVTEERKQPDVETVQGKPYKAFEVSTVPQRRIDLRPGYDAQRIVPYSAISETFYAGDFMLDLEFYGRPMHVAIRGRNLGELIAALREERAVSITEYIPEWHAMPAEDEPFVETLEITKPGLSAPEKPSKH